LSRAVDSEDRVDARSEAPAADAATRGRPRSRLVRWLPPLIALAMTVGLLEVGSCVYLRAFEGYDGEHLMNYRFDPYKNIALTPGFRDTRGIRHNAQGFRRDEDTPVEKPPDVLRVFLMGGSTGYGLHSLSRHAQDVYPVIRNDETIDHYLEEILRDAVPGYRVEVINAAITSFQSHHHLIYLNQKILDYDPDLVLFLDGFNDYYEWRPGFDQFRDYAYQERAHAFLSEPSVSAWAHFTGWWLFRKSHFVHVLGKAMKNVGLMLGGGGERPVIDVPRALVNLRDNAERNFVKMVERNALVLQHEDVDAIFALQPEIAFEQSKEFSPLESLIYEEMQSHWPENYIAFKNAARPIVLGYLQQAAAVGDAQVADLTDVYGSVEGDVYTDYCHLTPRGNAGLAEAVAPLVEEMLLRRVATGRVAAGG